MRIRSLSGCLREGTVCPGSPAHSLEAADPLCSWRICGAGEATTFAPQLARSRSRKCATSAAATPLSGRNTTPLIFCTARIPARSAPNR
jgi:hypothetical protein